LANDKEKYSNALKQLEQISAKRQKYVVRSDKKRRDLSADPTVEEMYAVLVTVINDLQKQRIFD